MDNKGIHIGVQYISPLELKFMETENIVPGGKRSSLISVFNYTLTAEGEVKVLSFEKFSGFPFLSYLHEDDTVASLAARLGAISGDPEDVWSHYKLAILKDAANAKYHQLNVRCVLSDAEGSDKPFESGGESFAVDTPSRSRIWEKFKDVYNLQATKPFNDSVAFPLIGIYRSTEASAEGAVVSMETMASTGGARPPRYVNE